MSYTGASARVFSTACGGLATLILPPSGGKAERQKGRLADDRRRTGPPNSSPQAASRTGSRREVTPARRRRKGEKEMQDKSKIISFRVTPEEAKRYADEAEIAGLPTSEYIRRRLNGSRIEAKTPITDRQTVATLRQIGGLIKQLFKHEKISKFELDNALKRVYDAIEGIQKPKKS